MNKVRIRSQSFNNQELNNSIEQMQMRPQPQTRLSRGQEMWRQSKFGNIKLKKKSKKIKLKKIIKVRVIKKRPRRSECKAQL